MIIILFFLVPNVFARIDLPKFMTKISLENVRFISQDGKLTYTQKRSGNLSLVTGFKSVDIIERGTGTNYYVTGSEFKNKLVIEVEKDWHQDMDLTKKNEIHVGGVGSLNYLKVGEGRAPRLHLEDNWITWFDPKNKAIHVQMLKSASNHHIIKIGLKHNPFYIPEVVMIDPETVLYTDINEKGVAALLSWNLINKKMTVLKKSDVAGTRFELCRRGNFVGLGEFSYDDANLGSSIHVLAWTSRPNLAGFTTIYKASDNDLGQMICGNNKIWFIKTMSEDRKMNIKQTEAVVMDITSGQIVVKSELERVTNIIEMDGRILIPFRNDIYVADGNPGSAKDDLMKPQKSDE